MGNIYSQDIIVKNYTYVIQELCTVTKLVKEEFNMKPKQNGGLHFKWNQQGRKSL